MSIRSGKKANNNGKAFENLLIGSANQQKWQWLRIPDGCKQLNAFKFIRIKSPFDFVLADPHFGWIIFCDAKSTLGKTFGASLIKDHQLEQLWKFKNMKQVKTGYIVNFDSLSKVVFFDVEKLNESIKSRKGLKPSDGVALGHKYEIQFDAMFT